MDATLKRRMWKVIGYHFFLSIYVLFLLLMAQHTHLMSEGLKLSDPTSWVYFETLPLLTLLQPISLKIAERGHELCALALTPFWSICFGWLYAKLFNWLNHFPILGKRVF